MAEASHSKYRLSDEFVRHTIHHYKSNPVVRKMYRIIATRDIPSKGVKAGDFGGLVSDKKVLSQLSDCWIGYDAIAYGEVLIRENAHIVSGRVISCQIYSGRYNNKNSMRNIIIGGDVIIDGSRVLIFRGKYGSTEIENNVVIKDEAKLYNVRSILNDVYIGGNATILDNCQILHQTHISGNANIDHNVRLYGETTISEYAQVKEGSILESAKISGYAIVPKGAIDLSALSDFNTDNNAHNASSLSVAAQGILSPALATKNSRTYSILKDIEEKIAGYQNDIVKLIKYPLMNDLTNPHTLAMVMAHKKVLREQGIADDVEFKNLVEELEEKFLAAESHAITISLSKFSHDEKLKINKAQDLLNIVINDAAAPQEKKSAYKQVQKNLEGLIAIPPLAVKALSERAGILELEI